MGLEFLVKKLRMYKSLQAEAQKKIHEKKEFKEPTQVTQKYLDKYVAEVATITADIEDQIEQDFIAYVNADLLPKQQVTQLKIIYQQEKNKFTIEIEKIGDSLAHHVKADAILEKAQEFAENYISIQVESKIAPKKPYQLKESLKRKKF
jgi:hypothetical protein